MSPEEFLANISGFLGTFYLALAAMNGIAALHLWLSGQTKEWFRVGNVPITNVLVWLFLFFVFMIISPIAYSGSPTLMAIISIPRPIVDVVNVMFSGAWGPVLYSVITLGMFVGLFLARRFFVQPAVAWLLLNASLVLLGISMTNMDFASIVAKADNVPIVAMVFLLGFFTWLATYQAVLNDDRTKQGLAPLEKLNNEKVLVWPDLVYTELICMVGLTVLLLVWAIVLKAPLEEPASGVKTPNPSKAPWYFLGLQEMLVYFDPWFAGVVAPLTVIAGLAAIPYLDFNKKGNGYYTIDERTFAYTVFQFGFLVLWITFIILGTFLRGPNWNFFSPFEPWDAHKVMSLNNVDLSQLFWVSLLDTPMPKAPDGADEFTKFGYTMIREIPGIVAVAAYFIVLPPLLAITVMRDFFIKMGLIRYMIMVNLLLLMAMFPIKMVLRWTVNLKYIIALPEYLLNF
jgi:hypothetical protein